MSIDNIFFDVSNLKVEFRKKVDLESIFRFIQKRYSVNEITKYALVGYYKWKRNVVLVSFTNEKVFIHSNKFDLPINGVYSYQDIKDIKFINDNKNNGIVIKTNDDHIIIKWVSRKTYEEMKVVYENEKTIFMNSKIGQNIVQSIQNIASFDVSKIYESSMEHEEESHEDNYSWAPKKGPKRVINDEMTSSITTFSSENLIQLFSNVNKKLPSNEYTLFKSINDRLKLLEDSNVFSKPLDSIALKFTTNSKINTIPVLAEFSSLVDKDRVENRLLFSRNWIEFTKHNVKNKLLGVDENGNGAYIDFNNSINKSVIKHYKAKEYELNGTIRKGIRSSQKINYKDTFSKLGLESMYFDPQTNNKLDISKYDGIIFLNKKYYFNIPDEFSSMARKCCRIQESYFERNIEFKKTFELIFENEILEYNVYDNKSELINDLTNGSSLFDLKWLTFFKD